MSTNQPGQATTEKFNGYNIHAKAVCTPPCPFHAPSDHPLKDAKIHIRSDKAYLVERICDHGVGHDDPDGVAYMQAHGHTWAGMHGCDGCCTGNYPIETTDVPGLAQVVEEEMSTDSTPNVKLNINQPNEQNKIPKDGICHKHKIMGCTLNHSPDQPDELDRILGNQRIFQAVFNDLKLTHDIVTTTDGRKTWAYTYEDVDPYELEDSAFPGVIAAIQAYTNKQLEAFAERVRSEVIGRGSHVEEKYLGTVAYNAQEAVNARLKKQRTALSALLGEGEHHG